MAAILGGGLGGLSTGFYLLRNNINSSMKIFLLEAANNCGGWIKSIRTSEYIFEQGPRTIRPKGENALHTLNMISELGLSEYVSPVGRDHPAAKNRMICVGNQLYTLPSSLSSTLKISKPFTKPLIYAIYNDLMNPHKSMEDDTIYNFVERRFGKEIADYAISPMICGICAGDAKEISVKFLLRSLFDWEQRHGGVIKGLVRSMFRPSKKEDIPLSDLALKAQDEKWSVYSLRGGLEVLPYTLREHLTDHNVPIHCNSAVEEIEFVDTSTVYLKGNFSQTSQLEANFLYSALPSHKLARLVKKQHPQLSEELAKIPFVDVGLVNLHFEGNHIREPGFGFLVPPIENSNILGVVFDSCCLPDQKGTVLTVMIGGKWFNQRLGDNPSKEKILNIAVDAVKNILKIESDPVAQNVNILHKCIPQYVVGHHDRIDRIRKYIKDHRLPISLIGSSYDGVSVNDVIVSAKTQVEDNNYSWY